MTPAVLELLEIHLRAIVDEHMAKRSGYYQPEDTQRVEHTRAELKKVLGHKDDLGDLG